MTFSIKEILKTRAGENQSLHSQYINPQLAKVLKTIGFDKSYTQAKGPYLYDQDNNEYLDFLSGYGVFGIGRNHPKIKKVLHDLIDLDTASLVQMEAPLLSGLLAEKLVELIGIKDLDKVYFTNSGTEAVETAIKFSRCATQRNRLLFLDNSFHGLTSGALALNGGTEFRDGFGDLITTTKVSLGDLEALEKELQQKDVAALFVEPIQGKGVYFPDNDYFNQAYQLCQKYQTLFIVDEVQTGLGRTGKWFAYEHWNLEPDMVLISKSLSGGMVPVGACLTKKWIYNKVYSRMDRCVVHSSTFGQNNLAMACGLATLEILKEENLVSNAEQVGTYLLEKLRDLQNQHEWIKEIRGKGLMIGIEFGKPQSLKNKLKWNMVHQMDKGLFGELVVMPLLSQHRILTQVAGHHKDIIKIIPPLVINQSHADQFVSALDKVLTECGNITGPIWKMGKNLAKHSLANKKAKSA